MNINYHTSDEIARDYMTEMRAQY